MEGVRMKGVKERGGEGVRMEELKESGGEGGGENMKVFICIHTYSKSVCTKNGAFFCLGSYHTM